MKLSAPCGLEEIRSLTVSIYSPFGAAFFVAGRDMIFTNPPYAMTLIQIVYWYWCL